VTFEWSPTNIINLHVENTRTSHESGCGKRSLKVIPISYSSLYHALRSSTKLIPIIPSFFSIQQT
jgi:hypothetical protein